MKNLKPFVFFAGCLSLCYLVGSFTEASFDITTWDEVWRGFVAVMGTLLSLGATLALVDIQSHQR